MSAAVAAAAAEPRPPGGDLLVEPDVPRLPLPAVGIDLERDGLLRAAALGLLAVREPVPRDEEPLIFFGPDEAVVFGQVEPEHFSPHGVLSIGTSARPTSGRAPRSVLTGPAERRSSPRGPSRPRPRRTRPSHLRGATCSRRRRWHCDEQRDPCP